MKGRRGWGGGGEFQATGNTPGYGPDHYSKPSVDSHLTASTSLGGGTLKTEET